MAESPCNHKQCSICLQRECHKNFERFKVDGELTVCRACVSRAVTWAYTTALRWGGDYNSSRPCGAKEAA